MKVKFTLLPWRLDWRDPGPHFVCPAASLRIRHLGLRLQPRCLDFDVGIAGSLTGQSPPLSAPGRLLTDCLFIYLVVVFYGKINFWKKGEKSVKLTFTVNFSLNRH